MNRASFAVSMHDVAPATWPACQRLLELVVPEGLPTTLLVVPRMHGAGLADRDASFLSAMAARTGGGDEVVLHGYFHRDDAPGPRGPLDWLRRRVYTAGEGEFDAIDAADAARRIADGLDCLRRMDVYPRAFVPPAWLLGAAALRGLAGTGLEFTSTRDRMLRIRDGAVVPAPSLVWSSRSAWRRRLSRHWNSRRLRHLRGAPLVRVALHPADVTDPATVACWADLIARLAEARRPELEFDFCARQLLARPPASA